MSSRIHFLVHKTIDESRLLQCRQKKVESLPCGEKFAHTGLDQSCLNIFIYKCKTKIR